ncbi:MAG TPA: hypothetical protein VNU68_09625 [Verrucomicrobiae bacterium]|nr:hypothetical protein [Verrucomicrobiae bacterium]
MKKILIIIAAVVLLGLIGVVLAVTLSLDSIVKKGVETVGPQITKTEMKLDGANISLFSGSGTLKGFLLGNPEGYKTPSAVTVGEVAVGVSPRSVFSDKVHVTHVRVKAPEITFEGTLGSANNLSKIMDNVNSVAGVAKGTDSKTPPADQGASKKLQVDDFLISDARVHVSMTMLGGKSLTVLLPEIHLANLGNGPDGITAAELTQRVLHEVTVHTLKAVEKGVADIGKVATDAASNMATNTLNKVGKTVGDLFNKKKE